MKDNFVSIGFTKKPFGTNGDLKVKIEDAYLEDIMQVEVLFLEIQKKKVPFFTENLKDSSQLLLKLEDIDSKEAATSLSSKEIFLREKDLIPEVERTFEMVDGLQFSKYIGFQIFDKTVGKIGDIENIEEFPQQEMAVLTYKEKALLLPLHEDLIIEIDKQKKEILMDLPEGILDL